ncbi:MAG: DUF1592 domain-containing protein [Myxococcota bacterium]|nr:DUF1592 domain-containing protein [Myxococcota bacterium]
MKRSIAKRGPTHCFLSLIVKWLPLSIAMTFACSAVDDPMNDAPAHTDLAGAVEDARATMTGMAADRPDIDSTNDAIPDGPAVDDATYEPLMPRAVRLTQTQVTNSIQSVFGTDINVPAMADPDLKDGQFLSIGATISTPSARGVESIESMSYAVAAEVVSPQNRERIVGCPPMDEDCIESFVIRTARRLWRRPPTDGEIRRLTHVFKTASERLDDAYAGLEFAIAAMLQSPHFVFRNEHAVDGRYTDLSLASKLSYLLVNTTPDDTLLKAAERGTLTTNRGLRAQIERLLNSPRAEAALLRFFEEWFDLEGLDHLNKDPLVFRAMSPELGPSARMETLMNLSEIIFEEDSDLRDLLIRRRTFVNRKLAAMYEMPAPVREGFGPIEFPPAHRRRGLLGQVSFLALHAHPVSTSATLRGMFIREALLCQVIPPPPAEVDTSIPEPSGRRQTLRDRVDEHLAATSCQGCHRLTDPIGLAFETFDGIGIARTLDNGGEIDPSGEIDGQTFSDAYELAGYLRNHPDFPKCLIRNLHRFVTGQVETDQQQEMLAAMTRRFAQVGYRFKPILTELLMSPVFREAGSSRGGEE